MNERIRKLERLCQIAEYNEFGDVVEVGFDTEKFAELLIRESARVADLADDNNCEWIGGNILTHFGFKE